MFSVQIFLVVAVGQNGLTNLLFVLVFLNLFSIANPEHVLLAF